MPASSGPTHEPAATTTTSASSLPPKCATRTRSPIGSIPNTGVSKWNCAPCRCACSIIAMRAAPDAMRPPPAWKTTVPSKRIPGQRSAATAGGEQLGGHVLLVERGDDVGDARRVAVIDRAGGHDEPDAGLVLELAPLGERLAAPADPERVRVAEPEDARRAVRAAARVAVLELLEHRDPVAAPGELPGRGRTGHAGTDDDHRAAGHGRAGYGRPPPSE